MIKISVCNGKTVDLFEMNNKYIGLVGIDEMFNLVFALNKVNKISIETSTPNGKPERIGEISLTETPDVFTVRINGKEDHLFTRNSFTEEIKRALSDPDNLEDCSCIAMTSKEASIVSKLQKVAK
jgi:hypothetical protein